MFCYYAFVQIWECEICVNYLISHVWSRAVYNRRNVCDQLRYYNTHNRNTVSKIIVVITAQEIPTAKSHGVIIFVFIYYHRF